MALIEHVREFRNRLGVSLLALTVCVIVALIFREQVFDFVKKPYCDTAVAQQAAEQTDTGECNLFAFGTFEQFSVSLRVSLIVGVLAS